MFIKKFSDVTDVYFFISTIVTDSKSKNIRKSKKSKKPKKSLLVTFIA